MSISESSTAAPLRAYLQQLEAAYRRGDATEHTYRSDLKHLIETLDPRATATNEPRRVACGAPDFIITQGQTPLGYIETKDFKSGFLWACLCLLDGLGKPFSPVILSMVV